MSQDIICSLGCWVTTCPAFGSWEGIGVTSSWTKYALLPSCARGSAELRSQFLGCAARSLQWIGGVSHCCMLSTKDCCNAVSLASRAPRINRGQDLDLGLGGYTKNPMAGGFPASNRGGWCSLRVGNPNSCSLDHPLLWGDVIWPSVALGRVSEGGGKSLHSQQRECNVLVKDGCGRATPVPYMGVEAKTLVPLQRRTIFLFGGLVALIVSSFPRGCAANDNSELPLVPQFPSPSPTESLSFETNSSNSSGSSQIQRSWLLIRSKEYSVSLPPGFEDVLEEEEVGAVAHSTLRGGGGSSAGGGGAALLLRFSSKQIPATISLVKRQVAGLRLTFFQANDIADLGTISGAADLFVPPGARLLSLSSSSARSFDSKHSDDSAKDKPLRTYYQYEFLHHGQHVALRAAINRGEAYVLGGIAPQEKWLVVGESIREALDSFQLG